MPFGAWSETFFCCTRKGGQGGEKIKNSGGENAGRESSSQIQIFRGQWGLFYGGLFCILLFKFASKLALGLPFRVTYECLQVSASWQVGMECHQEYKQES